MRSLRHAALAGILICLVAMAAPAQAITNGQKVVHAPTWIAYVTTTTKLLLLQTTESSCTGQVVSPQWVLTAAHCVVNESSNGDLGTSSLRPQKFSIVLGRLQLSQSILDGGQFKVDRVVVYPGWDPKCICGDAALLHLTKSVAGVATAVPLARSIPTGLDAQNTFAYGYGFVRETWSDDAVRNNQISNYQGENANFLYRTKPNSYRLNRRCNTWSDVCLDHVGSSIIRNGDSGGPWVNPSEGPSLYGLTSYFIYRTVNGHFEFPRLMITRLTSAPLRNWITQTAGIYAFKANTIYQTDRGSLAWFVPATGPALPIRKLTVLNCLKKSHRVARVSAVTLTELIRTESGRSASCA
jgi:secreted trypsin-like serine protease